MTDSAFAAPEGGSGRGGNANRRVAAMAAALAVAIVAALVYFVFLRGDSGSTTSLPAIPTHSRSATPTQTASKAPDAIPAVYDGPAANNPFKPLVVPPTTEPPATTAPSPTPTPTPSVVLPPPVTTPPAPTVTATVTATPSTTPSTPQLPTAGKAVALQLVEVDATKATVNVTVTVDGVTTPYDNVEPAQIFATYFKLVSVLSSDPASPPQVLGAAFQYGDQFVQLEKGDTAQLS